MGQMATDTAAALADKRAQLEEQLAVISTLPEDTVDIAFGKRIGDGTSQAVDRLSAVPAHDSLQVMLREVIRAQVKIDEETHGLCDECGSPIGTGRLEVRPWATRCIEHTS